MKKLLCIFLVVVILCGCEPFRYEGDEFDLYTVAANNVIGAGSAMTENVMLIETDSFGRKLFLFSTSNSSIYSEEIYALCICQKSDAMYTYYYEDDCVLLCDENGFVQEEVLQGFKNINDWEKELNDDRMATAVIVTDFNAKPEYDMSLYKYAQESIDPSDGYNWSYYILCSDKTGRQLIILAEYNYDNLSMGPGKIYAVIVNEDGSIEMQNGIIELDQTTLYNYREILKEFKSINNWNR